ncbi:hypothetical protein CRENBAI_010816, partial [Crenichthys baileyi]
MSRGVKPGCDQEDEDFSPTLSPKVIGGFLEPNGPEPYQLEPLAQGADAVRPEVEDRMGPVSERMGSSCHYPPKKEEHRYSSFQILVNEDNFEILEWKEDSHGSVPKHSIRTCSSEEIYVGKNECGLGKLYPKDRCFYLPWKGTEYWYWYYEVLTLMIPESNLISDVKYDQNHIKIFKEPPKTIQTSVVSTMH